MPRKTCDQPNYAHTQMALRMLDDDKAIQMTENLDMDITAYKLSQHLGDDSIFAGYVAGNYDASADYWKLISRSDGSHFLEAEYDDDGKLITDLTIEYYAEGKDGEWELVGKDFHKNLTESAAGSIVQFLGRDRAAELLGSHLGNADLYDKQTLMDVLDVTDMEASKIQRSGRLPDDVTELQLTKLAGEALLKKNGFSYTPETSWKGGTMAGLQLVDNNTMGYISFGKGDGSYDHERFVVTASLVRDTRSLSGYTYGKSDYQTNVFNTNSEPYETKSQSLQSQYRELDQITYRKYGLNNEMLDTYTPGNVQSVDVYNVVERIMEEYKDENGEIQKKVKAEINRDQPYYLHGFGWTQGNTVMSDYSLRILSLDNCVENIMEIHNAWTMDGDWINKAALDNDPGGRWLVHSSTNLTSDGCFIYQEHTLDDLQSKLKEWGLHSGHHISGSLKWF